MENDSKQVYRYWISSKDNKIHKEIAYAKKSNKKSDWDGKYYYVTFDIKGKLLCKIDADEFENNMLKRSIGQSIFLYKENDELAIKHFKWAVNEKINSLKAQLDKNQEILSRLELEDIL